MNILVACERFGVVRNELILRGHNAWSCDIVPSEVGGNHIQDDVLNHLNSGWDMMIAFPPCQYISFAGARWKDQPGRAEHITDALIFFRRLLEAPIPKIAIENPRGMASRAIRLPDAYFEPYFFGDPYKKRSYLWLKNLAPLLWTHICAEYEINWTEHSHRSAAQRAKTFPGVARAMASQWCGDV